ncbi:MAG: 6-phosphogluconolactonase [Kiritimatiellia bacterium]
MKTVRFSTFADFLQATAALLKSHTAAGDSGLRAVIIPGGATPRPVYREIAARPWKASPGLRVFLTDERMVPADSPDSNFGNARNALSALGIPPQNVLGVSPEKPLQENAAIWNRSFSDFFDKGGTISLALLGLGSDGHTASLFPGMDIKASPGLWAAEVRRPGNIDRVTVTPSTIARAEKTVFLAAGKEKSGVADRFARNPSALLAGRVSSLCPQPEFWYSENGPESAG